MYGFRIPRDGSRALGGAGKERAMTNMKPRIVAWELTRRCHLKCAHCRAASADGGTGEELTTEQIVGVMDDIVAVGRPMLILTGGEPMLRADLYEIIESARERGLAVAVAPSGTLIGESEARRMVALGVHRVSVSLDGPTAAMHDEFRGVAGAFQGALRGCEACRKAGLPFQINTTLTVSNIERLEEMVTLAARLGAAAFHTFSPVPVGRGMSLARAEIAASLSREFLERLLKVYESAPIPVRVTCAPQFYRLLRERTGTGAAGREKAVGHDSFSHGCIAGRAYAFIGAEGNVQPCGYLPLSCGNVLAEGFGEIWEKSEVLRNLRDARTLKGKCSKCGMIGICGGCRARAYAVTGDYLAADPFCTYSADERNQEDGK